METTTRTSTVSADLVRRYARPTAAVGLIPTQRTVAHVDEISEVDALWQAYKGQGSSWARDKLILHYLPLVASVAGRIGMRLPNSVDQADLVSYGTFGLIDALEKYELSRDVRFESYASSRIRGAILDELRAMDWVPRSVRAKSRSIERACTELEAELHRSPSRAEVAERVGMTEIKLDDTLAQVAVGSLAALDEVLTSEDRTGGQSLRDRLGDDRSADPLAEIEALETSHLLARAIESLGERERLVVVLYYFQRRTLAEIGRLLGVTESRVSQMHTAAVGRLRLTMREAEVA